LHTAIDKSCNFDILNESATPHVHKHIMIPPEKRREEILCLRKTLLTELKLKCAEHLRSLIENNQFEPVKQINVIAAIKNSIQLLALKEHLLDLENTLKKEYKEIFEPIPHANLLPSSETARIQLKDTYKKIPTQQYSIPRQFQELSSKNV
jgi:hypothetical protein